MMKDNNQVTSSSLDITEQNIEKLKELFPEVLTENKIDFEKLRLILGDEVETASERYNFTWNGKKQAMQLAQQPTVATLKPNKAKSKNWGETQNLYIEGDNLEVLKILQKSYANKVKLIYLDPPYNTGKDFIYRDNFHDSIENYLEQTGQVDNDGNKLSVNTETSGRYHTDWLNMMYPRLKLIRNLLDDKQGVLLISINSAELDNLVKLVKEIFGENNYIDSFIWQNKKGGGNDSKFLAVENEYVLFVAKNIQNLKPSFEAYSVEYKKRYKEEDEKGRFFWDTFKRKSGKQYYPITMPDGTVLEKDESGNPISWLRSEKTFLQNKKEGEVRFVEGKDGWSVHFKQRMPEGKKPRSLITDKGTTSSGSDAVINLFGKSVFSNPKPVELIKYFVETFTSEGDLIADFFSGSGTTAQAAFEVGNRKWLLVSLPENLDEQLASATDKQMAQNAIEVLDELGMPHRLTALAEERIRRAGELNSGENKADVGFKVFELEKSNLKKWNTEPEDLVIMLGSIQDNLEPSSTEDDLVYEIMLKQGLELTLPIEKMVIGEVNVYKIAFGSLFIALGKNITSDTATKIVDFINDEKLENVAVVLQDTGFVNDSEKLNSIEILNAGGVDYNDILSI
ncbi:site-specific DNA-methyltransferase [Enterococcus faecalis]|nr:site-specific DNA-methyltransferase [Enterococcus faecalis]